MDAHWTKYSLKLYFPTGDRNACPARHVAPDTSHILDWSFSMSATPTVVNGVESSGEGAAGRPADARLVLVPPGGQVRSLSRAELVAVLLVGALVAIIAVLGFVNSFAAVAEVAVPSFGDLAYTLPIAVDLGIFAFTALDLVLARLDMRVPWLRLIPWSLTAGTIYLNVSAETTVVGKVAHAILPSLWVVAVEVGAHIIRRRAKLERGKAMDAIRAARWVLAPWPTWKLWRRMNLWEIRSYPEALRRERDRVLALTDLQDAFGSLAWRWKAPRRARVLYRLGELAPGAIDQISTVPNELRQTATGDGSLGRGRRSRSGRGTDLTALMPVGRAVAATLANDGVELTRDTLAAGLRAAGESASNVRVGALLTALKREAEPE